MYRTLHCLRLRVYWSGMYAYVKRMCQAYPGCTFSNPSHRKSSELVYNFLTKAPFLVMHFDAYVAGKHAGFKGSDAYLLADVECAALLAWNPSLTLCLLCLPQQSCVSYSSMAFATQLCLTRIASSLVSAARRLTYFKLIVTSYQVPTTILCSSSKSIGTSIKACGSCATNKIQFEWPLRPSSYFFMLGIYALFHGKKFSQSCCRWP